jgi:hypothetical protein
MHPTTVDDSHTDEERGWLGWVGWLHCRCNTEKVRQCRVTLDRIELVGRLTDLPTITEVLKTKDDKVRSLQTHPPASSPHLAPRLMFRENSATLEQSRHHHTTSAHPHHTDARAAQACSRRGTHTRRSFASWETSHRWWCVNTNQSLMLPRKRKKSPLSGTMVTTLTPHTCSRCLCLSPSSRRCSAVL